MKEHVMVLQQSDWDALGAVCCVPGLQVATQAEEIWIRGIAAARMDDLLLRALPARHTYQLDERGYLFPMHGLTPVRKLPDLKWIPLAERIQPELPISAMPGKVHTKLAIRLVPSSQVEAGVALLTTLATWKAYANQAPQIRLESLRFAVSEWNQVLIMGTPLPAIPGREYWMRNTLLLPSGFDLELPLLAGLLANKVNPQADAVLVLDENGTWEKIAFDSLIPATRSAVRLTKENLLHE